MSALHDVAPQLGKLVRLLASPVDGEALGAARAIGRTLASAGADFHGLAEVIERGVGFPTPPSRAAPAPKPPKPKKPRPPRWTELDVDERLEWFAAVRDAEWATPEERERAGDLHERVLRCHDAEWTALPRDQALRAAQLLRRAYWTGGMRR